MGNERRYASIGLGVLRSTTVTIVCLLLYTLITSLTSKNMETKSLGITFLIITLVSVLYGAAYAARKAKEKGWLVGMLVGLLYILLIYIISIIAGRDYALGMKDLCRVLLCVFAGTLSGMLGINL
ncbi:TIGR04086 family membrane protein [Hathewaya histolytica]|uniref:Membrane protein n=1 Tax=Hathewaya histolytica TaxID=1498 RepID=A0A4U9RLZ2_HATHI|nr:TIGR04086 family membrane protein [Hathewaya histolytica]VTQ92498.1 membrane protein [Hathewaya histolytica]